MLKLNVIIYKVIDIAHCDLIQFAPLAQLNLMGLKLVRKILVKVIWKPLNWVRETGMMAPSTQEDKGKVCQDIRYVKIRSVYL